MSYRTRLDHSAGDADLYYTSTAGNQYSNGTLTLAPGQTSATFYIALNRDSLDERDEAVTLELYNLSPNAGFAGGGTTLAGSGIILDDDGLGPNEALIVSDPVDTAKIEAVFKDGVLRLNLPKPAPSPATKISITAE